MDLVAVTLPPVKSSAVKNDNTIVKQGGGTADGADQAEISWLPEGESSGVFTVGRTLTFVRRVRTCFAPQTETGECPRR